MKTKIQKSVSNELMDEAKKFKEFRKAENLTQKEIAVVLKKDTATITRYENGEFIIPIDIVKALHEELQMNYNWFFGKVAPRKFVPEKSNLVTDVKTLATNQSILEEQVTYLKKELLKLHKEFHASKHAS